MTAAHYEAELEANLTNLLERFKPGGIECRRCAGAPGEAWDEQDAPDWHTDAGDKILQRAVLMVLEPVYEQDFLDCSYGFGRSVAHTRRWMRCGTG